MDSGIASCLQSAEKLLRRANIPADLFAQPRGGIELLLVPNPLEEVQSGICDVVRNGVLKNVGLYRLRAGSKRGTCADIGERVGDAAAVQDSPRDVDTLAGKKFI